VGRRGPRGDEGAKSSVNWVITSKLNIVELLTPSPLPQGEGMLREVRAEQLQIRNKLYARIIS
jgi:hypothetical protein